MILNKAIFATIYLNNEKPNRYDITDAKERNDAKAIFARRTKYDTENLKKTLQIYTEMLAEETDIFIQELSSK